MCGFVGLAESDPRLEISEDLIRSMADTLEHRGPDDEGVLVRAPFGLGFRRLSIIDLEGGHQPMFNEAGDVACVCNGELYNFRELRTELRAAGHEFRSESDAEVVVHAYEEYGDSFVERLSGMFALCVLDWRDSSRPRVLLARDRIGVKPLYWAQTDRGLAWGSECKALLASGKLSREMSASALMDYLVQGFIAGEASAWVGIQRLLPAHTLTWSPGSEPELRRYWSLPTEGTREAATASEIREAVDRAVESRLVADVPLGVFLSGGIDSTAVATSMAARQGDPIVACSVGFEDKRFDELDLAKQTASALGATHHTRVLQPDPTLALEVLPWFYDEPLADPSTVPTYLVSKMAREHVTVALAGDGGDEVFGGYRRYVFDTAENKLRGTIGAPGRSLARGLGALYPKLDWAPRFLRAKSTLSNLGMDPAQAYWRSLCPSTREEATEILAPELVACLADHDPFDRFHEHYSRPKNVSSLYRAQYADFHGFLPDQILTKTDRASMANSLEVRVPLLDHEFVERFVTLPIDQKIRNGRGKVALREALRGKLSDDVLDGAKRGFETPLRSWIRGPLASSVAEALETLPSTWIHRPNVKRKMSEHLSGARDHSSLLWSLLVLEHWRRRHDVKGIVA